MNIVISTALEIIVVGAVTIAAGQATLRRLLARTRRVASVEAVLRERSATLGRVGNTIEGSVCGISYSYTLVLSGADSTGETVCVAFLAELSGGARMRVLSRGMRSDRRLPRESAGTATGEAVFDQFFEVDATDTPWARSVLDERIVNALLLLDPCVMTVTDREVRLEKQSAVEAAAEVLHVLDVCVRTAERVTMLNGTDRAPSAPYRR